MRAWAASVEEVFREASARWTLLAYFTLSTLFILIFALAVNLDIVDGALAGAKLFGKELDIGGEKIDMDRLVLGFETGFSGFLFGLGTFLALFATAHLGPRLREGNDRLYSLARCRRSFSSRVLRGLLLARRTGCSQRTSGSSFLEDGVAHPASCSLSRDPLHGRVPRRVRLLIGSDFVDRVSRVTYSISSSPCALGSRKDRGGGINQPSSPRARPDALRIFRDRGARAGHDLARSASTRVGGRSVAVYGSRLSSGSSRSLSPPGVFRERISDMRLLRKLSLPIAVIVLVLAGGATPVAAASDEALALVPPDVASVGVIRLDALRASPFAARLFSETDQLAVDGDAAKFLAETGLRPRQDVDVVVVAAFLESSHVPKTAS